jgi:hypothetical protein
MSRRFGELEFPVGVTLLKFPNGGSWSFFLCPQCPRRARKLWLLDGRPACDRCCDGRHVRMKVDVVSAEMTPEARIGEIQTIGRSSRKTRATLNCGSRRKRLRQPRGRRGPTGGRFGS